ncbi:LLM class flavin-dependent oxidoreductase [Frankia sp. EAN1pec]|uniref:LLM class flavin-dependent oxidoreductase n=1 Tax=Parafrankia sp. (strain EAN1pec) TaxID=298653 RepID=UPI0018DBC594
MQIGLGFFVSSVPDTVALIERAERAGIPAVWAVMPVTGYDTPTLFAAALARTERIIVGTSIVPVLTRHPVALLSQAATLEALAPGRLRLGVGTGNLVVTAAALGAPVSHPLARVREYVDILRAGLRDGKVHHDGTFYTIDAELPASSVTPVVLAALGPRAFATAGAVADAAMSWHCPPAYLDNVARPALARGAASAGRAIPPIVQQVAVAVTENRAQALEWARPHLVPFVNSPVYATMFAEAGYPQPGDGIVTDELLDALIISGSPESIIEELAHRAEVDEVFATHIPGPDADAEIDVVLRILATAASRSA